MPWCSQQVAWRPSDAAPLGGAVPAGPFTAHTPHRACPGAASRSPADPAVPPPPPRYLQVLVQPEAVRFPRKPLQLNFAVLLMRSSYDAVDALDFLPMEQFEVRRSR